MGTGVMDHQDITDLDLFKRWLIDNPITIMYPLATPIETPLSESELAVFRALKTNKLTTTVLNDAGAHMQLNYVADTKTYIDNRIEQCISAAIESGKLSVEITNA